jgi:hypothetical protein
MYKVEAEWIVDGFGEAEVLCEALMLMGAETTGSSPVETNDG